MTMDPKELIRSPPGIVAQRDRHPHWICDYAWSGVSSDTPLLASMETIQFGHVLERILHEILLENPYHRPTQLNKTDLSCGFYQVVLNAYDVPKLGVETWH